jgi:hypothetical protein
METSLLFRGIHRRGGARPTLHSRHQSTGFLQTRICNIWCRGCCCCCRGLAAAKPSLVHLVSTLLGQQLRGADGTSVHDVYEDASATLALVERELLQEAPTPPLPPPAVKVSLTGCRSIGSWGGVGG